MTFTWLTSGAPAAIAIIRLPALATVIDRPLPAIGRARFARLITSTGAVVDEVVVTRCGDDQMDVMCHGGPGIRAAVDRCLRAHGLDERAPDLDPRWAVLAAAPSPAAAMWLLRHGATTPPFRSDFLRRLPVVLIVGPTNAGKSTLLNAWCGHDRALTSDIAGTTRDLVTAETVVAGWRLRLIDSAGERPTDDALEAAGQDLVRQARAGADVVLRLDTTAASSAAGEMSVLGKADLATCIDRNVLVWSALGIPDHSCAELLARLGDAVLATLGLPRDLV